MASPFFIQSKLGDLVIDIRGDSTNPNTLLDAYPKKTASPDWDNQHWTFVQSANIGYWLGLDSSSRLRATLGWGSYYLAGLG